MSHRTRTTHDLLVEVCRCTKQDIPEVEAVIAALTPRLEKWWLDTISAILRRGDLLLGHESLINARLPEVSPTGIPRRDIEAELTRILTRRITDATSSLPADLVEFIEDERDHLIADAITALVLSLRIDRTAAQATIRPLLEAAVADLETLVAGRVRTRLPEIQQAAGRWVVAAIREADLQGPSFVPSGVLSGPALSPAPGSAAALRAELEALLGASTPKQWLAFVTDQWSYRWWNITSYTSARTDGYTIFVAANNPPRGPDAKTTPFCRWVHGRVLSVEAMDRQILRHVEASLAGDIQAMMANWPLLPSAIVADRGPTAEANFDREFTRVELPPYHARCRTVPQAFRPTRGGRG